MLHLPLQVALTAEERLSFSVNLVKLLSSEWFMAHCCFESNSFCFFLFICFCCSSSPCPFCPPAPSCPPSMPSICVWQQNELIYLYANDAFSIQTILPLFCTKVQETCLKLGFVNLEIRRSISPHPFDDLLNWSPTSGKKGALGERDKDRMHEKSHEE